MLMEGVPGREADRVKGGGGSQDEDWELGGGDVAQRARLGEAERASRLDRR